MSDDKAVYTLQSDSNCISVSFTPLTLDDYFYQLKKLLIASGHEEKYVLISAADLIFDESFPHGKTEYFLNYFDAMTIEKHQQILEEEVEKYRLENLNLKAKLSRLMNPDNPNYTDEEIEAMSEGK